MKKDDKLKVKAGFEKLSGFPYCLGAVDGSHIRLTACPQSQRFEYGCYKGFTSFVLFRVCDADRRYLYADVGWPGVLEDATIYERSVLRERIESGV